MSCDLSGFMVTSIEAVCLLIILWTMVVSPLLCTWLLWRKEHRLQLFMMDKKPAHTGRFEGHLWQYAKFGWELGILAGVGLMLSFVLC